MKKAAILISIFLISASAFSQRVIPVAKRTFPKTPDQTIDLKNDDFGKEYVERAYQGQEEDTAAINAEFLRREKLKEGKFTDPERKVVTFDYEEIFFTNGREFDKIEAERKKSQKAAPANKK
jgi:hypothetical protein